MGDDISFYADLPAQAGSLKDVLTKLKAFEAMPGTWQIIVADIQGSTKATAEGRTRDINAIAGSCVIACLNIAKKYQIEIPFFYGGDGAALIVPLATHQEMIAALNVLKQNTLEAYGLTLRIGSIPVQNVYDAHKTLLVAKWMVAPGYDQAICLGEGLSYADKCVKDTAKIQPAGEISKAANVDLMGLMCRWDEIHPQSPASEVVCLILQVLSTDQAAQYAQVLDILDHVYGKYDVRHPVKIDQLTTSVKQSDTNRKTKLTYGHNRFFANLYESGRAHWTALLFKRKWKIGNFDPEKYLRELTAAADTLHLSGTLYTLMSGTSEQRLALRAELDILQKNNILIYGIAVCPTSVMTCYVQSHQAHHIHFLDGVGGGYTQASKEFKQKIAK